MKIVFWSSVFVIVYAYAGYPLVLLFLRVFIHRRVRKSPIEPYVTLVVPAYNESRVIEAKIRNAASLDYPPNKLEVLIASDGSSDGTVELASKFSDGSRIRVLAFPQNRGKILVLNDAVREAKGEIIVFSDASAILQADSIRQLVANFADPKVGAVSGIYRVQHASGARLGSQEEMYWKYETFLRMQESLLASTLGGHGQILGVRKDLYPFPAPGTINDDFVIPVRVLAGGSRVIYEPLAVAFEEASEMVGFQRRVRIMAGNMQSSLATATTTPAFFLVSQGRALGHTILLGVSGSIELLSLAWKVLPTSRSVAIDVLWPCTRWKPMAAETAWSALTLLLLLC